ncbi:MAG: hypothetical protein ACJ0A3_04665 [Dehalococcoidia bacterium]
MLLDKTLFEDFGRGDSGAMLIVDRLVSDEISGYVSTHTIFSLWNRETITRRTEIVFQSIINLTEIVMLSANAAKDAAIQSNINSELDHDIVVLGSIAKEMGVPICTRRVDEFQLIINDIVDY